MSPASPVSPVSANLAQVCLFSSSREPLKRFCEVLSGRIEIDNGELLSFHMGGATVAHHRPVGVLGEDDVLVTIEVGSGREVDHMYQQLKRKGLTVDDLPEDTDWGWRVFYFRAGRHLLFEVGAPLGANE